MEYSTDFSIKKEVLKVNLEICYRLDNKPLDSRQRRKSSLNLLLIIAKFFRLSHDVVTCDVDRDVSTAYC